MNFVTIGVMAIFFAVVTDARAQDVPLTGRPDVGVTVFKKCMACHQVGSTARTGIGPTLNGLVGRRAGTAPGYNYSTGMKKSGLVWDEQTLTHYLRAPRDLVPGTKMSFAGLKKDQEIADVIAYLKQFAAAEKQANNSTISVD